MRRFGALTIAVAMTVTACGGSNETVAEPDVEVEVVADGVVREAGDDVQVINGCRIEPNTQCPEANLSGADLSDADLEGANLSNANLSWSNLAKTNLRDTDLTRANLSVSDLRFANLYGANLEGANLTQTFLRWALFCDTRMPDGSVNNDNC